LHCAPPKLTGQAAFTAHVVNILSSRQVILICCAQIISVMSFVITSFLSDGFKSGFKASLETLNCQFLPCHCDNYYGSQHQQCQPISGTSIHCAGNFNWGSKLVVQMWSRAHIHRILWQPSMVPSWLQKVGTISYHFHCVIKLIVSTWVMINSVKVGVNCMTWPSWPKS
jgi:hypothetical protein